jgi:hypothetical protein
MQRNHSRDHNPLPTPSIGAGDSTVTSTPFLLRYQEDPAARTPATIAKHLSAIRGLAAAVGAHAAVRPVGSASVARGEPRALSHEEFARLMKMPDRRTTGRDSGNDGLAA